MSMVWIYLPVAGVPVYKSSKPDFFSSMAKEIGGSRACGVLLTSMKTYIMYNSMDSLMKWAKKTERTMRSRCEGDCKGEGHTILGRRLGEGSNIVKIVL